MLVENVTGKRRASSMMKTSEFYIEVAKFVQAYRTIVTNPNEFLTEIQAPTIDEKNEKLTWAQFVEIVHKCDLGFKVKPTNEDLVVYYNYALEIGTINPSEKKLATVDDVADAQKHYYNFIDEAKDKAEEAYLRQRRTANMRQNEFNVVDKQLSNIKAKNCVAIIFMLFAGLLGAFAVTSCLFTNPVIEAIGSIIPVWEKQYIGAIIIVIIAILLFALFDKLYLNTKREYKRLYSASATIFDRNRETYEIGQGLKRKLNSLKKDLKQVQAEINDKHKTYDVKHNIDVLKVTNKYYKKLCEFEEELDNAFSSAEKELSARPDYDEQEFAPVKLTKEQEENLRGVSKEAIKLEGQFDVDAYNEKFEKSTKKEEEKEEAQEQTEEEISKEQEQAEQEELLSSIDYIKSVLGMSAAEQQVQENSAEKEK